MSYSSRQKVLDLLREPYFWRIFNAHKEKRYSDLWRNFNEYNQKFSVYDKSKWHSEVLNLAERFMQEDDEWRFLDFVKDWNLKNLLEGDWKEVKKDGNVYKPLAIKCLKKAFNITKKHNNPDTELGWLIEAYKTAILKFPDDEWVLREYAILLIRNHELQSAIEIYKRLALELGDKAYIWHEFSLCFDFKDDLKTGMLSKAIELENNDDYLGDIRLELSKALIEKGLQENALNELIKYQKHREKKGWSLSEKYSELLKEVKEGTNPSENKSIYENFIPIAEEYAYSDMDWVDILLVDVWKNDKNKDRCRFGDGKQIEFSINKQHFKSLNTARIGNVFKCKLYKKKKEISEKEKALLPWNSKLKIEYEYIPLLISTSEAEDWSILPDEVAVIEYINSEKKVIHAITISNEEVFFKDDIKKYKINDFIIGKRLDSEMKGEKRIDLYNIKSIDRADCIEKFKKHIAIVDHVNHSKNLFHFIVDRSIHGVIKFNETTIRPKEGSSLEIRLIQKVDKKRGVTFYKPIEVNETEQSSDKLIKTIYGTLELKYKRDGSTLDFDDLGEDAINTEPDFGFIEDFYVSRDLLKENGITYNCDVTAKVIFTGEKWKVIQVMKNNASL